MSWRIMSIYLSAILLCVSAEKKPDSPYKALQQYKFPAGLLPEGVTSYSLNESSGEFSAHLNGSCSFTLENSYELRYEPVIKGLISQRWLKKLSGVSVKVVLLWLDVVEVKRNGESLEFSVGFKSADFPVENFEECPRCGCGFDCGTGTGNGNGNGNGNVNGNGGVLGNWSSFLYLPCLFATCV